MPFDHPLAQARETWKWPDIACVISAGEALVRPDIFRSKYASDCSRFCKDGAGKAVAYDDFYKYWISTFDPRMETDQVCPGKNTSEHGIFCSCSFPDRL